MGRVRRDTYALCDRAIQEMNRENLKAFGKLKLLKFDELKVLKAVTQVYRNSAKRAHQHYYEEAFEEFVIVLMEEEIAAAEAHRMAEKTITRKWVDEILQQTDFVTLYRFDTETERKIQRLVEALAVSADKDHEVDKALKLWSRQLGQYAINFTDYAALAAWEAAGVKRVQWVARRDDLTCEECAVLNGQIFDVDEVPAKPHPRCRCFWTPVKDE